MEESVNSLRKVVFADTDTLSSFLWSDNFNFFLRLFEKLQIKVIIPRQVMDELEYSPRTKARLADKRAKQIPTEIRY